MSTFVERQEQTYERAVQAEAAFEVKELRRIAVRGTIPVTHAVVQVAADGQPMGVRATLDPRGIATGHPRRDKDLQGKRFLCTEQHPAITFVGDRVTTSATGWTVAGTLTIRGISRPVTLSVKAANAAGPGRTLVATTRLDRRDFGIVGIPRLLIASDVDVTIRATVEG